MLSRFRLNFLPSVAARLRSMNKSSGNSHSSVEDEVLFDLHNKNGIITINRPKALNALNLSMVEKIYTKLRNWRDVKGVRLVIIEGTGDKAFCAGGDVRDLTSQEKGSQSSFFRAEYRMNHLIGTLGIPYVALLNGITMGGGVGVSVHGEFRVATEKTIFAMPETGIGLFPDVGGSHFLPKLPGQLGMYLGLTGFRLKGADNLHAGIATHGCKADSVPDLKKDLLNLRDGENVVEVLKKYDSEFPRPDFSLRDNLASINECFSAKSVEGIIECLSKRKGDDVWAEKTADTFKKLSPTSVKVAYRQIREGANLLGLKECLEMEYRLVCRCLEDNDFYEGVRALLVEKDNRPKWNPKSYEEVGPEIIDHYFSELPEGRELKLD